MAKGTLKSTMAAQEREWRAESDMRTLIEAEKIKKDRSRLTAALKKGKQERDALSEVVEKKET